MSLQERYARQLALPELGTEGQQKIANGSVLCVGLGGLGSTAALHLTGAGVGRLGLIDGDCVAVTDLHRQVIYSMEQIGMPKAVAARNNLAARNPDIGIETYHESLTTKNAIDLVSRYDVVLDCSDNYATRFLVSDACYFAHCRWVHGSVFQFGGQVTTFLRIDSGPCYRCLYRDAAPADIVPSTEDAGVYGIAAGIIGLLQANEALKMLAEVGEILHGRLLLFDALASSWRTVKVRKDLDCPLCGTTPTIETLAAAPAG